MAKVSYRPHENGDPIETKVSALRGSSAEPVEFIMRAGELVEIPDDIYIMQMVRVETMNAEGLPRAIAKEQKKSLVELLAANPYFSVEKNGQPVGDIVSPKRGRPATPKTPQEYRAHAQAWIAAAKDHVELKTRWDNETALRDKIGVSDESDDVHFLKPFFEAKYHELKKAEAA